MRPSNISFVNLDHIHVEFRKVTLSSGASFIDLPDWMNVRKAVVNAKNNDDRYFPYSIALIKLGKNRQAM